MRIREKASVGTDEDHRDGLDDGREEADALAVIPWQTGAFVREFRDGCVILQLRFLWKRRGSGDKLGELGEREPIRHALLPAEIGREKAAALEALADFELRK